MPTPTAWEDVRVGCGPGVLQGRWMGRKSGGTYPNFTYTNLLRFTFTASDGREYELRMSSMLVRRLPERGWS